MYYEVVSFPYLLLAFLRRRYGGVTTDRSAVSFPFGKQPKLVVTSDNSSSSPPDKSSFSMTTTLRLFAFLFLFSSTAGASGIYTPKGLYRGNVIMYTITCLPSFSERHFNYCCNYYKSSRVYTRPCMSHHEPALSFCARGKPAFVEHGVPQQPVWL